jgi:hypothetical protein
MKNPLIALIMLLAAAGLAGCGPTLYNIKVNGYTDPAAPAALASGSSFFVIENQQAQNPLLEKEIAEKLKKLLTSKGYALATYDQANYYLFFSYGIGQERAARVILPDYTCGLGIGGGAGPGYCWRGAPYFFAWPFITFYPGYNSFYDRWLLINVVDGKYYRDKGEFRPIWVGEARSTGASGDLRSAINYLLLADFQQFGSNTGQAVAVEVSEDAPRMEGLIK